MGMCCPCLRSTSDLLCRQDDGAYVVVYDWCNVSRRGKAAVSRSSFEKLHH
jgi:hypothetical protein